jgi:hypothetical protein
MSSQAATAPAARDLRFLVWCGGAVAMAFLLQLWLFHPLIADYSPTLDEFAIEVASTNIGGNLNPLHWFTEGFHYYFVAMPEWSTSASDFWRPLANLMFWLHYQLFGANWSIQLVFAYLIHAIVVGVSGLIALRVFNLDAKSAVIVMIIAFFNPAFWSASSGYHSLPELIQYPIFQTEIVCALLMLLAFLAFIRSRYALFCVIATVALLLKETALTVPVSAIALMGAWRSADARQSAKNFAWLLLPLLIWYVARKGLFEFGKSIYVLKPSGGAWSWLVKPIRNMVYLPTTLYHKPLTETRQAFLARDYATAFADSFRLATNCAWWLAVLYAFLVGCLKFGWKWFSKVPEPWVCGLLFASGNLSLVLVLQTAEPRFSYFWFTLGPAAIFGAFANTRFAFGLAAALGAALVVPQMLSVPRHLSAESIGNYHLVKQSSRQLIGLLHDLPPGVTTAYLVDDVIVQASTPDAFAQFAGFHGKLVLVNSVDRMPGCKGRDNEPSRYRLERSATETTLRYIAPDCFAAPWNTAPLALFNANQEVARGPWMKYKYPELKRAGDLSLNGSVDYDVGRRWSVTVNDPVCNVDGACVWIGFDPSGHAYHVIGDSG